MTLSRDMGPNPMSFLSMFWQNQFRTIIPLPPKDNSLSGKTGIITGSNTGLGFECAKQMLGAGLSKLVMGVRSVKKGQVAATELQSINPSATIDVWGLDMEDYDSIQKFADQCRTESQAIDFVILNAGLAATEYTISPRTGHEVDIQVNFLSTILLTILLLPILKAKNGGDIPPATDKYTPRISIVSSATTRTVKFPTQDVRPLLPSFDTNAVHPWDAGDRYGTSKLLVQLIIERIATHYVNPSDVLINLVEPGWVKHTGLNKNLNPVLRAIVNGILAIAGRPLDQGAATYYDAVVVQDGRSHGSYVMNCRPAPYGDFAYLDKAQSLTDTLWDETMVELEFMQAKSILESMKSDK